MSRAGALWVALLLAASPIAVRAEWPYLSEEAANLREGDYSVSLGVARALHRSPRLPGGRGVLWTLPQLEATLGVGPHAEVALRYQYLLFEPTDGRTPRYESGDLNLWTKLGLFPSWLRDVSARFGVKLPNASDDRDLGTDETDFHAELLYDLHLGPLWATANGGIGILGSTTVDHAQDDVVTWGAAARLPLGAAWRLGLDAWGFSGPHGRGVKRDVAVFGLVGDWAAGPWRLSLAGRRGIQDALGWGWVVGVTYQTDPLPRASPRAQGPTFGEEEP